MGFKAKTCVRYNDTGHAHCLTFSCCQRLPLLRDPRACQVLIDSLAAARTRHEFDLWAYVIMPEHVHVVLCPRRSSYSISTILAAIKRPAAYRLGGEKPAGLPHYWQPGGGYDRNLFKVQTVYREIEYLHANPVRRGLCQAPEQWRFSSAGFWLEQQNVPLEMDTTLPPRLSGAS